jgi:hypothetical protein
MTCASCRTEIADKALICYRCGRATATPRVSPPAGGSIFDGRRRSRAILLAKIALAKIAASPAAWVVAAMGAGYAAWAWLVP